MYILKFDTDTRLTMVSPVREGSYLFERCPGHGTTHPSLKPTATMSMIYTCVQYLNIWRQAFFVLFEWLLAVCVPKMMALMLLGCSHLWPFNDGWCPGMYNTVCEGWSFVCMVVGFFTHIVFQVNGEARLWYS